MRKDFRYISVLILTSLILSACSSAPTAPAASPTQTQLPEPLEAPASSEATAAEIPASPSEDRSRSDYSGYEIVTLLPKDAIPAIDNPIFLKASEADEEYAPDELILGVEFNSEARAYSINLLSRHEIVNDNVGGAKIAVTW